MKRMSTATHGILDYVVSGASALLPPLLNTNRNTSILLRATAATNALYSSMTNYERGLVKVIPMKAHLTLDALSGGLLLGASMMLDDEEPEVRATLASLGIFEILAALTTQTRSTTERGRRATRPGKRPSRRYVIQELHHRYAREGTTLVLSGVLEQPVAAIKRSGLWDEIGAENIHANIDAALDRARELLGGKTDVSVEA
jgi:hypothetical protein